MSENTKKMSVLSNYTDILSALLMTSRLKCYSTNYYMPAMTSMIWIHIDKCVQDHKESWLDKKWTGVRLYSEQF